MNTTGRMAQELPGTDDSAFRAGMAVEVRNRYNEAWAPGFQVVGPDGPGRYRVRRTRDDYVLPVAVAGSDLRRPIEAFRPDPDPAVPVAAPATSTTALGIGVG